MTNNETIVNAVKAATCEYSKQFALETKCADDSKFVLCHGAYTHQVAEYLGVTTKQAKSLLEKSRRKGLLHKYSTHNSSTWWPDGYLSELKLAALNKSEV